MRDVVLVRHGESEWNAARRWQGWIDVDLTEQGIAQARSRGRALAARALTVGAIYCSDLRRARHTAELVGAELGGITPIADPGFRERHGGAFQGLTIEAIADQYPDELTAWRTGEIAAPPGGESTAEVLARFDAALAAAHATTPPGVLVVVTHGGVVRIVEQRAGVERAGVLDNCGELWCRYDDATIALVADDEQPACAGA